MANKPGLTSREAAIRLGVSLHHLYELLWEKKISARKKGGRWFVLESAIQKRLKKKTKHGK